MRRTIPRWCEFDRATIDNGSGHGVYIAVDDLSPMHAPDQPSGKAEPLEDALAQQRWKRVVHGRVLLSWRLVMGAHAVL